MLLKALHFKNRLFSFFFVQLLLEVNLLGLQLTIIFIIDESADDFLDSLINCLICLKVLFCLSSSSKIYNEIKQRKASNPHISHITVYFW